MRQIVQHMGQGLTEIVEAPAPSLQSGALLIASTVTLISAGTERMLVDFGKANVWPPQSVLCGQNWLNPCRLVIATSDV